MPKVAVKIITKKSEIYEEVIVPEDADEDDVAEIVSTGVLELISLYREKIFGQHFRLHLEIEDGNPILTKAVSRFVGLITAATKGSLSLKSVTHIPEGKKEDPKEELPN